jgi:hypothetical protein
MEAIVVGVALLLWMLWWLPVAYFALAIVVGVAAQHRRGRSGFGWFLLALLISPLIAGLLVLALRTIEPWEQEQRVPWAPCFAVACAIFIVVWVVVKAVLPWAFDRPQRDQLASEQQAVAPAPLAQPKQTVAAPKQRPTREVVRTLSEAAR